MSLRFVSSLNSPPFVAAAGVAVIAGLPFVEAAAASGAISLSLLQGLNLAAFAGNCAAVSVPGRIDEQQDVAMRQGALNPSKPGAPTESTSLNSGATTSGGGEYTEIYSPSGGRSFV